MEQQSPVLPRQFEKFWNCGPRIAQLLNPTLNQRHALGIGNRSGERRHLPGPANCQALEKLRMEGIAGNEHPAVGITAIIIQPTEQHPGQRRGCLQSQIKEAPPEPPSRWQEAQLTDSQERARDSTLADSSEGVTCALSERIDEGGLAK